MRVPFLHTVLFGAVFLWAASFRQTSELSTVPQPNFADRATNPAGRALSGQRINTDQTVRGEMEVRNGILHFRNADTFAAFRDVLWRVTDEKRIAATRRLGFTSVADIASTAYLLTAEAPTRERFSQRRSIRILSSYGIT